MTAGCLGLLLYYQDRAKICRLAMNTPLKSLVELLKYIQIKRTSHRLLSSTDDSQSQLLIGMVTI